MMALALTVVTGCPKKVEEKPKPEEGPVKGGKLIVGFAQEPDNLNPAISVMAYSANIYNLLFPGVVKFGPDLKWEPDLVESVPTLENGGVEVEDDKMTVTYKLKKGIEWSDGKALTSDDVKYVWELIMDKTGQKVTPMSTEGYDRIEAIDTPDEQTVVVKFKQIYAPYLALFDNILPKHVLKDEKDVDASIFNTKPTVALGPFVFKEWKSKDQITIVRNDKYFGEKANLDEIIFKMIPETQTIIAALKTGEIDLAWDQKEKDLKELAAIPGAKVYSTPGLMYEHIDFMVKDPVLAEVKVRQAIELGIDKQKIVDTLLIGKSEPANSDQPPTSPWHDEALKSSKFDPTEAKRLLDEAGWKPGADGVRAKDGQRLSLSFSTTAGNKLREDTQVLIQSWMKDIGVEIKIQNYDAATFFSGYSEGGILSTGKYQIGEYTSGYDNPLCDSHTTYHSTQIPSAENEYSGLNSLWYANDKIDKALEDARKTVDVKKQREAYQTVSRQLREDVPTIFLYWRLNIAAAKDKVKGWEMHPVIGYELWNANELWLAK